MATQRPSGQGSTRPRTDPAVRARQLKRRGMLIWGSVLAVAAAGLAAGIFLVIDGSAKDNDNLVPSTAHILGSADARVTLVEWADFQCPFCANYANDLERQLRDDLVKNGTVRLVFRHLAFLGEESVQAAQAAECAADQGKFWEYHDRLFANWAGENKGAYSDANLKRFAVELGLNAPEFNRCLDTSKYQKLIQDEAAAARNLGVRSTPTFFTNGDMSTGAPRDYANLKARVLAAEKK